MLNLKIQNKMNKHIPINYSKYLTPGEISQAEFEVFYEYYLNLIDIGIKNCPLERSVSFPLYKQHKKIIIPLLHI